MKATDQYCQQCCPPLTTPNEKPTTSVFWTNSYTYDPLWSLLFQVWSVAKINSTGCLGIHLCPLVINSTWPEFNPSPSWQPSCCLCALRHWIRVLVASVRSGMKRPRWLCWSCCTPAPGNLKVIQIHLGVSSWLPTLVSSLSWFGVYNVNTHPSPNKVFHFWSFLNFIKCDPKTQSQLPRWNQKQTYEAFLNAPMYVPIGGLSYLISNPRAS